MAGSTVGVVGASGFLGGELLRLLAHHPRFDLVQAVSASHAGEKLGELHPHIGPGGELVLLDSPDRLDCDLAFLALPAGESMACVPSLLERGIRVVDLSPDYRLKDPRVYRDTYGQDHRDPEHLGEAVYGLTEWNRDRIRTARLVANPGCYPTAVLLALRPLSRSEESGKGPIVIDAKSGTSGAGASPTETTHHSIAAGNVQPYGGRRHRHVSEILQELPGGANGGRSLIFKPHVIPLVRGILCSVYLWEGLTDGNPPEITLDRSYVGEPFVHVVSRPPRLSWTVGSNDCFLSSEPVGEGRVIYSTLDNLGKGGAGQAIQNANRMMGWPEDEGLFRGGLGL
jgi:N-acetyl-gamma-glutamyl-phosphate reductase